jgi:hypothetical protein
MAIVPYMLTRDAAGNNSMIGRVPEWVDARVLAAGVAESHTVPTGADIVEISSTAAFYCKPNGTAAVPAADVSDGTASELNPTGYVLRGVTSLGLISAPGATVTMKFYRLSAPLQVAQPDTLPGLAAWMDAQDAGTVTFSTGSDIVGWANKGNMGVPGAAQSTGSLQPLYVASAINGLPAVQFYDDSTVKELAIAHSAALALSNGYTYFAVIQRVTDLAATEIMLAKWVAAGNQRGFELLTNTGDKATHFASLDGTATGAPTANSTANLIIGTPYILNGYFDGALISTSSNNANTATAAAASVFTGTAPVTLGAISGSASPFSGYIGEILFYNRYLSVAETAAIEAYLSAKWGIAIQ